MLYVQMTGDFDRKPHLFSCVNDSMLFMGYRKDNMRTFIMLELF